MIDVICGEYNKAGHAGTSSQIGISEATRRSALSEWPTVRSELATATPRFACYTSSDRREADLAVLILIINLAASPPPNEPMVISDHD